MPITLAENAVVAGRFKLNRMIGRGGMGSVWQATHLGLDIPCAVKFIEGEISSLGEAQTRFEREAKAAAQLRSPHVVQILDHGVCEGTPYIAMELLDGEDLGKRVQKLGRMHPREVCTIMTQVARALTKAHTLGIVHRDLKPDNIFLVRDDDREIAKVLDFGIAKLNGNALEGSNTKTGAMLGTPYYMSPEQAQGIKTVDYRSDLWSLAVIVYQCVTGVLPFESEALGDLLMKIIVQPMPIPSQVVPDLPPGFDGWWARAASRDPAGRFQGAKEFAESLQMVLGMSQVTDVMDRGQLRAVMGATPQPGAMRTPAAYGATTPAPGMLMAQPKFAATTGAGVATAADPSMNTFAGAPKKGPGMAIVGIGAFVAIAAIIGGVVMLRGHGDAQSAAASAQGAQTQTTAPPVAAPPATPPPQATAPTPQAPATAAPAVATADPPATAPTTAPAAATNDTSATKHTHHSPGTAPAPKPTPAPTPAKPAAPKATSQDMGF